MCLKGWSIIIGGGGGEGYYVWGEGYNILSTDLGRDFNFWTAFWGGS